MSEPILVLGSQSAATKDLLVAAHRDGHEVHLATHANLWSSQREFLREYVDTVVLTNFATPAGAIDELLTHVRTHDIRGVVTGWEFLGPLVTEVADRAGLPGNDATLAMASRNKARMAHVLRGAGIAHPITTAGTSPDSLLKTVKAAGMQPPFVVKPAENGGSVAVSVVAEYDGIVHAFRQAERWTHEVPYGIPLDTSVLVQEYVPGPEVSVESVVAKGVVTHLAVTAKDTTTGAIREELGHTIPARLEQETEELLYATVEAGLRSVGVTNGVAHTEVKLPRDGVPTIIEIGARPPGGHIMRVLERATGVDMARCYLDVSLGLPPKVEGDTLGKVAAIRFLSTDRTGRFDGVSVPPLGGGHTEIETYLAEGDMVGGDHQTWIRVGHVIVMGEDHASMTEGLDRVDDIEIKVG